LIEVSLSCGCVALVDDDDLNIVARHKWHYLQCGYAGRTEHIDDSKRIIYMHRELLGLSPEDKIDVDHINGNGLDNQRSNLRLASHRQNIAAGFRLNRGTSRYRGVCWDKGKQKWLAQAKYRPQQIYIGRFNDEVEAAIAYDLKAIELWGEFARPNFLRYPV
jgi:hypothetical protein